MNNVVEPIVTIATAIIGVAILSVLVSTKSNTSGVLSAFGNMFSNMLSAATAPVNGTGVAPNVATVSNGGVNMFGGIGGFNMPGMPVNY